MSKTFAHPRALVVSGVDINRDLEVLGVFGNFPKLPGPSTQRVCRKNLLCDADRILHTGKLANQLWSERQRLDAACEPTKDHIATSEPIVHELADPPGHR